MIYSWFLVKSGWPANAVLFLSISTRKETVVEANVSPRGLHQRLDADDRSAQSAKVRLNQCLYPCTNYSPFNIDHLCFLPIVKGIRNQKWCGTRRQQISASDNAAKKKLTWFSFQMRQILFLEYTFERSWIERLVPHVVWRFLRHTDPLPYSRCEWRGQDRWRRVASRSGKSCSTSDGCTAQICTVLALWRFTLVWEISDLSAKQQTTCENTSGAHHRFNKTPSTPRGKRENYRGETL